MRELSGKLKALFEGAGPLAQRLQAEAPFISGAAMIARARHLLAELNEAEQIAVINAHPRIGENAERVRAQSAASFKEQGYDRDDTPSDALARLAQLNEAYEHQFGFRFVVFVNGRPKAALIPVLEARMKRSRAEELQTALADIVAIAEDRLRQET
ncbi:MAG TPA: 2-oxo-4-hydroxy-4-carboxy-5-ureidoimidazoline decarboxylase [Gemmatimonadales bacterium]|nr:2-oxo-4-hydroxy-4-carboxy-5-ureidoimidazoline decarboxylase [Gemmatimonadales bacterium]